MAFSYYRPITVDHTKAGSSDHTDFTFPVAGTYAYLASVANGGKLASANDLAFYSDASLTTLLDFERVYHNLTTGEVEYWVRLPSYSHSTDTVIYLAYSEASPSDHSNRTAVWTSNNWNTMVKHYGDGTTLSLADSTSA